MFQAVAVDDFSHADQVTSLALADVFLQRFQTVATGVVLPELCK